MIPAVKERPVRELATAATVYAALDAYSGPVLSTVEPLAIVSFMIEGPHFSVQATCVRSITALLRTLLAPSA